MIDVEIQNFQSIKRSAFRIEGFTALVGRSNIGKSAAVRAIQCALTAATGTDFVRHGESCERLLKGNKKCRCQTTVTLKFGERTLKWEKGDSVNQYTVTENGEDTLYTALERGTPEFLKPDFELVPVGSKNDLVQVGEQFSPIFLLDQSGPATADVLSDVARLDDLNKAIRLANKDRKEAVSTRKVREKDVKVLEEQLEAYEGLDTALGLTAGLDAREKGLQKAKEVAARLDGWLGAYEKAEALSGLLGAAVKPPEPDYQSLRKTRDRSDRLDGWFNSHQRAQGAIGPLEAAVKPPEPEWSGLNVLANRAIQLTGIYDELAVLAPVIRRLRGLDKVTLPNFTGIEEASKRVARFDEWLEELRSLKVAFLKLKGVQEVSVPGFKGLDEAEGATSKLGAWEAKQEGLQALVGELAEQLTAAEEAEQEILKAFEQLGICPTCEQRVDPSHMHAEAS